MKRLLGLLVCVCVISACVSPPGRSTVAAPSPPEEPNERFGQRPVFSLSGEVLDEIDVRAVSSRSLTLNAYLDEGDCLRSTLTDVKEGEETVHLFMTMRVTRKRGVTFCRAFLRERPVRVQLQAPLGNRQLVGTIRRR